MSLIECADLHWPENEYFLPVEQFPQTADSGFRCTAAAVCDESGDPLRQFSQGQWAHFYFEFAVDFDLPDEVPAGGLLLRDGLGRPVFGKNSFQMDMELPAGLVGGSRLRYHQSIKLDLQYGPYTVSFGLATAASDEYQAYRNGPASHETFNRAVRFRCLLPDVVTIQVGFMPEGKLLHHGLANLPGEGQLQVLCGTAGSTALQRPQASTAEGDPPTLFHITHWKAGSQWIYRILEKAAGSDRLVRPQIGEMQFLNWPIRPGGVYPTVYVTAEQYAAIAKPPGSRHFVVLRDLRDTLVSAYYSLKFSHQTFGDPQMEAWRSALHELDEEAGLLRVMDGWVAMCAAIQRSWIESGEPLIRYEDLLGRDVEILEPLLLDHCRLPIERSALRQIVLDSRFAALTGGRPAGQEDFSAHQRKGVAGDWQRHFTPRLKKAFKLRYGGLLVAAGYETGLGW